jgi:hypothetical protein
VNPEWEWWAAKLAGKLPPGAIADTPQAGFYRKTSKEFYGARKTFTPVAYWPGIQDGRPVLYCREGDKNVGATRAMELWNHVCDHPVSEEAYRDVAQYGKLWPDEHELVPMQKPGPGHNLGPEWDWNKIEVVNPADAELLAAFKDRLEDLSREAKKRLEGPPIADQDECDRIANLADALAQLDKIAETSRKAERKPHDEALKAIQLRWAPLALLAEVYKDVKYKLITPWLQALDGKRKQEAEAAAAAGKPPPSEAPRPRAGTRGRAMSLKSTKKAQIDDYAVCLKFFEDSADVRATVQMLADRAVRAGITVPGVTVIEEGKAV